MTKLKLREKTTEFLRTNPGRHFTAREIAEWIFTTYPEACEIKRQNSDRELGDNEFITRLAAEVGKAVQKKDSRVQRIEERRPYLYYYGDSDVPPSDINAPSSDERPPRHEQPEKKLYPKLGEFLYKEFKVTNPENKNKKTPTIYSKRIDEKKASNKQGKRGNHWLYPDVVAMEDLTALWNQSIKDSVNVYAGKKVRLWSFEVKVHIRRSDVREVFFQAVSNSSWANYGYLVAAELDSDATRELQILSALHGIGFIQLNAENPSKSQIKFPARERDIIDLDTANRIAQVNIDFKEYIEAVANFCNSRDPNLEKWDLSPRNDDD